MHRKSGSDGAARGVYFLDVWFTRGEGVLNV